ncbi:hypothetical protein ACFL35_08595 [Candidatus Riflebacteria bacterium]
MMKFNRKNRLARRKFLKILMAVPFIPGVFYFKRINERHKKTVTWLHFENGRDLNIANADFFAPHDLVG